jgi:cytochrome c556
MTTAFLSFVMLAVAVLASLTARGQDRTPGLTGADRPDDVVMARQLLMAGIDQEIGPIDRAAAGQDFKLADLQSHAYMINTLLTAFPHLFPPQTKPAASSDGTASATAATAAVWQNFEDFYRQAQGAAATAYDASQAANLDQFKDLAKTLRAACDGCHARYMRVDEPPRP